MNRDYADDVEAKRRYVSTRRDEQARRTRRAILTAAEELFVAQGYGAKTLTQVAATAGVAVQTVYAVFGNKRQLLSDLLDVTVAGDDEPVALAERAFVADIDALTEARDKLARYAVHLCQVNGRVVNVMSHLAD